MSTFVTNRTAIGACTVTLFSIFTWRGYIFTHADASATTTSTSSVSTSTSTSTSTAITPVGSGTAPYWTTRRSATVSPPATRTTLPTHSDVVVIGAGMSGASAAMHLAQQGVKVTLLDARGVSEGATGRNGGFLFPPALPMLILAAASGKGFDHFRKSAEILFFERDNRAAIRDFVKARNVKCELDHNIDVFQVFDSAQELQDKVGAVLWPLRALARVVDVDVYSSRSQMREVLNLPVQGPWCSGLRLRGAADTFCAADVARQCVVDAVAAGADWLPHTSVVALEEEEEEEEETESAAKATSGIAVNDSDSSASATAAGGAAAGAVSSSSINRGGDPSRSKTKGTAGGSGVTVVTACGARIHCEKVIVATNAYIPTLVPSLQGYITPVRNHVGVTALPVPPLNISAPCTSTTSSSSTATNDSNCSNCSSGSSSTAAAAAARCGISCEHGFVYMHQRPDGRVVLGGFRNKEHTHKGVGETDDSYVVPSVAKCIKEFIPSRFDVGHNNDAVIVDQIWTGIIGWSCDDLPWVGPVPNHPSIFVCGGFSGHGLTQTFLCGQAVAAMILGQKPKYFVRRFLPSLNRSNTADLVAGHPDPK